MSYIFRSLILSFCMAKCTFEILLTTSAQLLFFLTLGFLFISGFVVFFSGCYFFVKLLVVFMDYFPNFI